MAAVVNAGNLVFCLLFGALTGLLAMSGYSREYPADTNIPTFLLVGPFVMSGASSALALLRFLRPASRKAVLTLGVAGFFLSLAVMVIQTILLGVLTAYVVALAFWFLVVLLANGADWRAAARR